MPSPTDATLSDEELDNLIQDEEIREILSEALGGMEIPDFEASLDAWRKDTESLTDEDRLRRSFQFVANARTFQDFTGLTDESMEVIYAVGHQKYQSGNYSEAETIFTMLTVLNHFEEKFWKALAASRAMQGKHEEALPAYGMLGLLQPEDHVTPFQCAKSFLAVGKQEEAMAALRSCLANSETRTDLDSMRTEASLMLSNLEKENRQPAESSSQ